MLFRGRARPPVLVLKRHFEVTVDDLQRLIQLLPHEGRAEDGMSFQYVLPRSSKRICIDMALHGTTYLDEISPGLGVAQALEEHRALHWRDGIDVLNATTFGEQLIELRRAEFRQRKIRRHITSYFTRTAMLDEQT